ncbi:hypothetical protein PSECIP111951_02880 [Pseudoalteromonas holothuriae]|uniref:Uncharacterized protein n=1 Tax=Pseudoalteromonas holothuriae TaxID=2963714 RepID=A0A9W4QZF6_9GAMM|nr:hypothetical protein PSECIP111854_02544 [Pseudoalteromonas sp. CIP111854]CAH9063323.1 hypothetical protein PSECIP111951_02880 [Pseudoalteromonas sp. CIP111951]
MLSNFKLKLKTKKVKLLSGTPVLDTKQTKHIVGGLSSETETFTNKPPH